VVHIFTPATRDFYSLERLWGDARHLRPEAAPASARKKRPLARKGAARKG